MTKILWTALAALALSACGGVDDKGDPGSAAQGLSAASCGNLFANHFEIKGGTWSARLTGGNLRGLSATDIESIRSDEGFFEDCGRSDVVGSYDTSSVPFSPDYTMKLSLESASCGHKSITITGNCNSDGMNGTASWNGRRASVTRLAD